jgi:hypothetical protein
MPWLTAESAYHGSAAVPFSKKRIKPTDRKSETLTPEHRVYLADRVRQVLESWDNRLDFPPIETSKRYLRGDLALRVEGFAKTGHLRLRKIGVTIEVHQKISQPIDSDVESGKHDDKFTRLVDSVHIMDDPKRMRKRSVQGTRRAIVGL